MKQSLKPNAKHIFDSEFDFLSGSRGRLNRLIGSTRAGGSSWPHLDMAITVLSRDSANFIGFASIPFGNGHAFGRAGIQIGAPSLGDLAELPFGWSALSDFCEGMVADDLCEDVSLRKGNGGHAARDRETVFAEIDELRRQGYRALRGAYGSDRALIDHAMR